jgi:transcriptional regulator
MTAIETELSPTQVRRILKRHRGSMAIIAKELGTSRFHVSHVVRRVRPLRSARVSAAALEYARKLLKEEQAGEAS